MNILFVNACVRGEISNTRKLCQFTLEKLQAKYPDASIDEVKLALDQPLPLYAEEVEKRSQLREQAQWDDPMFDYAKQFAKADLIVIGAPYWDLGFPSVLKIYLERICVVDITFAYDETGKMKGLCKAEKLLYISTVGGPVVAHNTGFEYIDALCKTFFSIHEAQSYMLCGLEMGQDINPIMKKGKVDLAEIISNL